MENSNNPKKYIILVYKKVCELFPNSDIVTNGLEDYLDESTSISIMEDLVLWLQSNSVDCRSEELIDRVKKFSAYCMVLATIQENRGETELPYTHIYTDYIVAFLEELFRKEKTQKLIPHIYSKENLLRNKDYYILHVGKEEYVDVLALY